MPAIPYWLMGSMESTGYDVLLIGAPPVILCTVILVRPIDEAVPKGRLILPEIHELLKINGGI